jgi:hypothetical protein
MVHVKPYFLAKTGIAEALDGRSVINTRATSADNDMVLALISDLHQGQPAALDLQGMWEWESRASYL